MFQLVANTQLSPWISTVNTLQYDTSASSSRGRCGSGGFSAPGNDLFLVYTHNWEEIPGLDGATRFSTLDNRLATKLVYTLRF